MTVDAVGQHAGALLLGGNSGDNAVLNITGGWLKVEDESVGPGNGELKIGLNPAANAVLNLTGGELYVKTLSKGAGGSFNFTGGVLHAETVSFDLVNNGGTIAPGNSPGLTHVIGDLTLNSGTLEIEIGGTGIGEYDRVLVDGVTMLGGTLKVDLVDLGGGEFVPELGDQFAFLASSGGTGGMFDGFDLPAIGRRPRLGDFARRRRDVSRGRRSAVGLAGDYNDDGFVDAADYTVWRNNLGGTALPFNETASLGTVDEADYQAWKDNFGATSGSGSAAGNPAVPEPSSMASAARRPGRFHWPLCKAGDACKSPLSSITSPCLVSSRCSAIAVFDRQRIAEERTDGARGRAGPLLQRTSISNPPRARRPVTLPSARRRAGRAAVRRVGCRPLPGGATAAASRRCRWWRRSCRRSGTADGRRTDWCRRRRRFVVGLRRVGEREQVVEHAVGVVAVAEPGPEVDLPGERPAGAAVAAEFERLAGGGEQLGRVGRDLLAGEDAPQMRDVAVAVLGVVLVFEPFLELAVLADLVGRDPAAEFDELGAEFGIDAENLATLRSCWRTGCE